MRNNDLEFEYNNKEEGFIYVNEERLEEEILSHLHNNSDVENMKIPEELSRDAYLSLTEKRVNIIKWYPFQENSTLLEIGAGYGELTTLLCSKLKKIDAYELKKERISIIQKRCSEYSNLTCYTGFLSEQEFKDSYDYILVHDIFAISRKFFKGENPNESMLKFLRRFLKKNGKLLLITENRLGLKYFAGAAEDYNRQFFWGINSFEQDERNRTFSKTELMEIIENSGFRYQKWFYPYPDAVCTLEIFSEDIEKKIGYGLTSPDKELCEERYQFFDEQRMFYSLHKEGIALKFANAFFVECGNEKSHTQIAYVDLEKEKMVYYQDDGKFVQDGNVLPEGVRIDIYLNGLVQQIVNCNLGAKNPYIPKLYNLIEEMIILMNQSGCHIDDIYIKDDKIDTVNTCNDRDEYQLWKDWYVWYENNIMFYRNASRRISLEKLMEILNIDSETFIEYLQRYQKRDSKYVVPRLPNIMFDFEPGGSKDRIEFRLSDLEESSMSDKLKQLHGTLHTEE